MNRKDDKRVKILFHLERDSDDYPPVDWEHVWAFDCGNGEFEIDNIPFFAKDISVGDIVSAHIKNTDLIFEEMIKKSENSTIRVIMLKIAYKDVIRQKLSDLGCETEASHLPSLFSVDIPKEIPYKPVADFLDNESNNGILEYQESALRHI
jgi:hypothetical protein